MARAGGGGMGAAMERAAWLRERRRLGEARMDTLWSADYDERWGTYANASHLRMVGQLVARCPPGARILDAACGTGRYWPLLLGEGRSLTGADQSAGMLARARAKFPTVPIEKTALQNLAHQGAFDAVACIDALEFVPPEDWPRVLANFHRALRPAGLLYLTVELPEPDLAEVYRAALEAGHPVVGGEYVREGGYHYYPPIGKVRAWLDASSFLVIEEAEGDGYHHILARRR